MFLVIPLKYFAQKNYGAYTECIGKYILEFHFPPQRFAPIFDIFLWERVSFVNYHVNTNCRELIFT